MPASLEWLAAELARLEKAGLKRELAIRAGEQRGEAISIGGSSLANFGSNDYLGLAADSRLAAAVQSALAHEGWGAGASPLVTGRAAPHAELERQLALWEETEAALLFPSGFAANAGTIPALVAQGDLILSDRKNHASLIDGCRLSGAEVMVYRHNDAGHVAELLAAARGKYRRTLIATDSLFSMDGDLAPLADLAELAEKFGAMLLVDEAHASGVFGAKGRGAAEASGVEGGIAIRIGTLSKAFGSHGGFVVGSKLLIDWLVNRARPYVFSTAAPAALAAAGLAALQIVRQEPERRIELLKKAAGVRQRLEAAGLDCGNSASQIIPVVLGDPLKTMQAAAALRARGFFVPGIRPPSVPEGESLLRISITWRHSDQQLAELTAAIIAVAR